MLGALSWALPGRTQPKIAPALVEYASHALSALIEDARQQAIADGVRSIPAPVNRALLGYFPPMLLQRCRFATEGLRVLSLPALDFSYGGATAITVGEIILFKSDRIAQADLKLWAHELTHVMQYQRWGIDEFANRYVHDSNALEQEAIDNANRFVAWRAEQVDG